LLLYSLTRRERGQGTIGIVAVETYRDEWQAYIGVITNEWSEDYALQQLAGWGIILSGEEAHAFFPQLDITTYNKLS
jgi:hypothetical protein